ncbi:MAG: hypothetical protein ACPGU0_02170, partial [Marinirhabdus sp.]
NSSFFHQILTQPEHIGCRITNSGSYVVAISSPKNIVSTIVIIVGTNSFNHIVEGFNQTKGERLTGLFTDNRLDTVNIDKNAEVIYYLRNDKNELTGINNTVSGSIQMYLENQEMAGTRFIKKVKGKIYPPSKFPEELRTLPGFNWRGDERLQTVQDLFKGKPPPVLPKIKGIPLPRDEGGFFEENIKDSNIPKASKLTPSILKNRKGDAQEIQGGPQKKTAHNPAAPANRSAKNESRLFKIPSPDYPAPLGNGSFAREGQLHLRYRRQQVFGFCGRGLGL